MARKGKYSEWIKGEGLEKISEWGKQGLTNKQIAKNIGITEKTLYEWLNKYSILSDTLKEAKEVIDVEVENAMLKSAMGFFVEEEKTYIEDVGGKIKKRKEITKKYISPNVTAQIFWLKNRKPYEWRDRREIKFEDEIEDFTAIDELLKDD